MAGSPSPASRPSRSPHSGAFGHASPSISPPAAGLRPLSHPNRYPNIGGNRLQSTSPQIRARDRRSSMFAFGQRPPLSLDQPLPHQPQAHFYGLPAADLGFGASPQSGISAGERGYACTLDTLASCGDRSSMLAENVVLVGSEGGLDVYKVEHDGSAKIGSLQGLRGAVIGAKILPWNFREDLYASERPLVGLVIHGPMMPEGKHTNVDAANVSSSAVFSDDGRSPSPALQAAATSDSDEITHYQTTVDVYSLRSGHHLASLLQCPPVPLLVPVTSPVFEPPGPVAELSLDAKGKFVTIASGTTGEIFVFSSYPSASQDEHAEAGFRLVGKFWTMLQHRETSTASSMPAQGEARPKQDSRGSQGIPLVSLSHRWLAIVPPPNSSVFSLNATALLADPDRSPPGFDTHTAPPQPAITCAVDASDGNGFLNWVAREVTQEFIKGARWVGEQGVQAWKNYWNRSTPQSGGNPVADVSVAQQQQHGFPPTHGNFTSQPPTSSASQPTLVAVYDLQRLLDAEETRNKNANMPIGTFPVPLGCSFLSFSPSGLWLMTVSTKGDCQSVWDLMRIRQVRPTITHNPALASTGTTVTSPGGGPPKSQQSARSGPHVRQIALFTRMTVARVVDISWSAPTGSRFSILTEKGTIHIFEMPQSAFQWPPPRQSRRVAAANPASPEGGGEEKRGGISPAATLGAVSSAMQAINGTTRPLLSKAMRLRSSSGGSSGSGGSAGSGISGGSGIPGLSSLTSIVPAAGAARSGKAVVSAGLSKSLGVASDSVNNIRHAGDNKLHLSVGAGGARLGCVRWLTGRGPSSIAVVMFGNSGGSGSSSGTSAISGANTVIRIYGVRRYSTTDFDSTASSSAGVTPIGKSGTATATAGGRATARAGSRSRSSGNKRPRSWAVIAKARPTEHRLPNIPDMTIAPAVAAYLEYLQSGGNAGENLAEEQDRVLSTDPDGVVKLRSTAVWALRGPASSPSTLIPSKSPPPPPNNAAPFPQPHSRPLSSDIITHSNDKGSNNDHTAHVSIPLSSPRPHNLSFAEIDSNPPYQPFHTDRRVSLVAYAEPLPPSVPVFSQPPPPPSSSSSSTSPSSEPWAFGQPIPGRRLQTGHGSGAHRNTAAAIANAGGTAISSTTARNGAVQSTTTTTTTIAAAAAATNNPDAFTFSQDHGPTEQIVVTSRRRRARPVRRSRKGVGGVDGLGTGIGTGMGMGMGIGMDVGGEGVVDHALDDDRYDRYDDDDDGVDDDGFFEDDCEVLDFATDRV